MTRARKAAAPERAKMAGFTREQLAASQRFRGDRDLVLALLEDEKQYTVDEVSAVLDGFKKGKVK